MQKFGFREIPLPIWKEIVEYVQAIDHVYHTPKTLQYVIAKKLGYELVDHRMELFGKKILKKN